MDMSQYRSLFLSEAREYLRTINETVVGLEETPEDRSGIDTLFRGAHSLKGMAASMEYGDIVEVAHRMEDLMLRVRDMGLVFDSGVADLLLEGSDLIERMMVDLEADREPRTPAGDLPDRLAGYTPPPPPPRKAADPAPAASAAEPAPAQATPSAASVPAVEPAVPSTPPPTPVEPERTKELEVTSVRVKTELLDHLANLTGELITNKNRLLSINRDLASPQLGEAVGETAKLLRALHDEVMKVRLMPFEAIVDRFQRSVRALAKKSGKELHFEIVGREIGLDRSILESLVDPINHMLRNAVDHGMEESAERVAAGKPARGVVKLSVARDRDRVLVTVSDDGRGMVPERMIASAIRKGLISPDEASQLSPRQALMLSCIPGFSTAREVTDVSGRGVGMDAVNASIQKLGGTLAIESEPGKGTRFTLALPMTIAIIHALVVQCGPIKGAVPVTAVLRTVELRRHQMTRVGNRSVFNLDGEALPLLSLNRALGLPLGRFPDGIVPLFVTEAKGRRVGIVVDRLLGQHELFIKPLGRPLSKLPGLGGGAVLGDGELITLLDVADLL
ncbi:chemotaxis protein CheA [Geomonas limicola]|uniref:histidine kinase n=1 Tax=Geomonas limicola TaxID=2740186 RepID=A0A6V8NA90_9BACT|nr:chemotaxis protein CheA [Geomonas limicola]GFO69411.1 chemotaxis protein CheA [Geomonas limicola]